MTRQVPLYALRLLTLGTQMPRLVRDTILFFAGLGLIFNEAVLRDGEPRFYLLLLYAAMIGLPAFLGTDDVQAALRRMSDRANGRNSHGPNAPAPPSPPDDPARPSSFARLKWRFS